MIFALALDVICVLYEVQLDNKNVLSRLDSQLEECSYSSFLKFWLISASTFLCKKVLIKEKMCFRKTVLASSCNLVFYKDFCKL